jgi:hypothetical protein
MQPMLASIPTPALPNVELGGIDQLVVKDLKRKLNDAHISSAKQKVMNLIENHKYLLKLQLVIQDSSDIIARLVEVTTTLNSSDNSSQHYRARVEQAVCDLNTVFLLD